MTYIVLYFIISVHFFYMNIGENCFELILSIIIYVHMSYFFFYHNLLDLVFLWTYYNVQNYVRHSLFLYVIKYDFCTSVCRLLWLWILMLLVLILNVHSELNNVPVVVADFSSADFAIVDVDIHTPLIQHIQKPSLDEVLLLQQNWRESHRYID
ncbi:hypothetical protein V8G54_010163 [Vigna mungo]|uniref:Uncharacterized protein n=1 Tax=Vigna mungo TaxID=3915 RepID=A0AAQ3NY19_VIGMU